MEKNIILENILTSFTGSQATSDLFDHFSTITTIEDTMAHYTSFCHGESRWYLKSEISIASESQIKSGKAFKKSTSAKFAGWRIVKRQSAKNILGDAWEDTLTVSQITAMVKDAWTNCTDNRSKEMYMNAVVYNNISSHKSELSGKTDSVTDNSEDTFSLLEVITELIGTIKIDSPDHASWKKVKKDDVIIDYVNLVRALQVAITK